MTSGINHVSIHAADLEASERWYQELFGLEKIPAPEFGYPVTWLEAGGVQLHLFSRPGPAPANHHFGITARDFHAVYLKAREMEAFDPERGSRPRRLPDGAVQLYLRDPAGNLVEVDWPDASTLDSSIVGELMRIEDERPQSPENMRARLFRSHRAQPLRVPGLPEPFSHYADLVRAGDTVYVSGLVALDASGNLVGEGDVVEQTRQIFRNLDLALAATGATPADVVKVTIFMRDVSQRPLINPVRQEFFGDHRPASTLVEVSRLVRDDLLLEIEATAVV